MKSVTGRETPSSSHDPWRYCCPECGAAASQVHHRYDERKLVHETEGPLSPYYCQQCSTVLDGLFDKKHDTVVKRRGQRP